ncbi:MAG: hypothetical protein ACT6S0_19895 [Roseateles sp.]|uniref:hypothetical protein n=1 Tax=Roseateles sp. TaxID=1971397 RepID=UPI0040371E78
MRLRTTAGFALMLSLLAACQPALNWREVRPVGAGAAALFPCKPKVEQRPARVGAGGAMGLAQCEAAGRRFALSWADMPDPTQVGAALKAMPLAVAGKVGKPMAVASPLQVPGMTPMPEAAQYRLAGVDAIARVAVFAHGGRVYQALLTGKQDDPAVWETFVAGLAVEAAR